MAVIKNILTYIKIIPKMTASTSLIQRNNLVKFSNPKIPTDMHRITSSPKNGLNDFSLAKDIIQPINVTNITEPMIKIQLNLFLSITNSHS